MEIIIVIIVIIGIFVAAFYQSQRWSVLSQEAHQWYIIIDIPMNYNEVKKIVNEAFPSLWWKDVPGKDGGIYKELKIIIGKYRGLGPTVGISIDIHEDNENIVDVFINLVDWETDTIAIFLTNYIGVDKAVKRIKKLRNLLGDPSLIQDPRPIQMNQE